MINGVAFPTQNRRKSLGPAYSIQFIFCSLNNTTDDKMQTNALFPLSFIRPAAFLRIYTLAAGYPASYSLNNMGFLAQIIVVKEWEINFGSRSHQKKEICALEITKECFHLPPEA